MTAREAVHQAALILAKAGNAPPRLRTIARQLIEMEAQLIRRDAKVIRWRANARVLKRYEEVA